LHSGTVMYSLLYWILPARFRCMYVFMYMLAVVTGGGLGGARCAVPLYKHAEPWLHACPDTYINTYIAHGHDCNRYVCSGTEPRCFHTEPLRPYSSTFLRAYLKHLVGCATAQSGKVSRYLMCYCSTHRMDVGETVPLYTAALLSAHDVHTPSLYRVNRVCTCESLRSHSDVTAHRRFGTIKKHKSAESMAWCFFGGRDMFKLSTNSLLDRSNVVRVYRTRIWALLIFCVNVWCIYYLFEPWILATERGRRLGKVPYHAQASIQPLLHKN
jgi:hypothetical protein